MLLKEIRTRGFRNLADETIRLAEGFNFLVGGNGQGKTSVLEAVAVLGNLASFRTRRVKDVIRFGQAAADVSGLFDDGGLRRRMEIRIDAKGRRVVLDGKVATRFEDVVGRLPVASFVPDDLNMIMGASVLRRRFLDRGCAILDGGFYKKLRDYQRTLAARNALLKRERDFDPQLVDSYDSVLAESGCVVSASRRSLVKSLSRRLEAQREFLGGLGKIELFFRDGFGCETDLDDPGSAENCRARLLSKRDHDRQRGHTTVGSHRDDFSVRLDGQPAKMVASRGQQRILAVSLLLALVEEIRGSTSAPILLLDDVSSELDSEHRRALFDDLRRLSCQVLVTTTDEGMFQEIGGAGRLLRVQDGHCAAGPGDTH